MDEVDRVRLDNAKIGQTLRAMMRRGLKIRANIWVDLRGPIGAPTAGTR